MTVLPQELKDALSVLAITVIIDTRVRGPEMEEFSAQAVGLAGLCGLDSFNAPQAITWYEGHEGEIKKDLHSRSRNTIILKALTRVKDEKIRESLYDAMLAVSVSDSEYHAKESDLVRSASSIWGFMRPPFKVADDAEGP